MCSRSDGLAIDALKTLEVKNLILSTESNTVVQARAIIKNTCNPKC